MYFNNIKTRLNEKTRLAEPKKTKTRLATNWKPVLPETEKRKAPFQKPELPDNRKAVPGTEHTRLWKLENLFGNRPNRKPRWPHRYCHNVLYFIRSCSPK